MARLLITFGVLLFTYPALCAQPAAFDKPVPETLRDLQDIEEHVQRIVARVTPATVCVRVGNTQGSGVIVDRDGRILTAGHVSGAAGREATIIFADGQRARGKTLGANNDIDSGMVILTENVAITPVEMAKSAEVKKGQWCLALGHPNGFQPGRPPVARLGRVQSVHAVGIITDCVLVGGDSGGPLVDMNGRVVGIHSRIGGKVSVNTHVPIDTFHDTWTRLAASDVWGNSFPLFNPLKPAEPYLGLRALEELRELRIETVTPGSPADKAGLKSDDIITKIDNRTLNTLDELRDFLRTRQPGNEINVHIQRGNDTFTLRVTLGKR
jgi:serine protease Do